jgi:hypothetical protein
MNALEDAPRIVPARRPARSVRRALLLGALPALVLLPLAAGCGDDTRVTLSATSGAPTTTPASPAAAVEGPPKVSGGLCERTAADKKSLPPLARVTVERFIAATDRGDRATMRALFAPLGVGEVLAHLRPVTRLGLIALEDRY